MVKLHGDFFPHLKRGMVLTDSSMVMVSLYREDPIPSVDTLGMGSGLWIKIYLVNVYIIMERSTIFHG